MKKGEARRQAIVSAAERLFFERGYEATSVQDILDEMNLSKGGFYHHFESKLQLLEAICSEHARTACARGMAAAQKAGDDPVKQLNALFRDGTFFGGEDIRYIALMMRTAYGGELSQLRERMRIMQLEEFTPALRRVLLAGLEKQVFYFTYSDSVARLIIMLACDVTDEIAAVLGRPEEAGGMNAAIELLGAYRAAVERIINAPYGSLDLVDMKQVEEVVKSLYVLSGRA